MVTFKPEMLQCCSCGFSAFSAFSSTVCGSMLDQSTRQLDKELSAWNAWRAIECADTSRIYVSEKGAICRVTHMRASTTKHSNWPAGPCQGASTVSRGITSHPNGIYQRLRSQTACLDSAISPTVRASVPKRFCHVPLYVYVVLPEHIGIQSSRSLLHMR
jgi:hypothetical protein